ncbi:MAG: hemolysin III family protein [Clostridia bacterium]|nr:hemolysin III family protein [Clostridia bacterium]
MPEKNALTPDSRRRRNEPPRRSVLEEVGNAVTHGVGSLLSIAALVLLLLRADTTPKIVAALVYGICMILMFTMSCLYHSFRSGSTVKRVWRRFDYISIYLLIGGTFAPLWLVYWGGKTGLLLMILQWIIIVTGVTFVGVFGPGRLRPLHIALYIVLGWSALVFLPGMIRNDRPLFWFILAGGIIYTLGIIPFLLKKKGAHFLWHFFVLFGAIAHWLGIYLYVY